MPEPRYLTVGELARKVGVTVRTLQYYDQAGLLSPSVKGPQNQRLYSEDNIEGLYRILTLKYLGFSLAEVKEVEASLMSQPDFRTLVNKEMESIEDDFQQLLKRLTTLRRLSSELNDEGDIAWEALATTIEESQEDSQLFWRLTCISDSGLADGHDADAPLREESVSKWHELIAEAIRLMGSGEPLDSPDNLSLARRFVDLDASQNIMSGDQSFILMENLSPHKNGDGTFDQLRQSVIEYIELVVKASGSEG